MDVELFSMLASSMNTLTFVVISCLSEGDVACNPLKYDCYRTERYKKPEFIRGTL